uniref:Putative fasciclin-like arabinogalactan protein n=1 Tax=Salicornia europaea TaxID=206448 RepID=Q2PGX7_SALEU|nr:putative fasciclin-like arabinogalactan protein [Salicornia europaea]
MQKAIVLGALLLLLTLTLTPTTTHAHNITKILAKFPDFSSFNHYLTTTHLAPEINTRQTITVLAIDNAAMASLTSKHLPISTLKNILSLHVLLDYFGAKKLHQITDGSALAATMYQATGSAPGTAGFVNITDLKGGKVGFAATNPASDEGDSDSTPSLNSTFIKSLKEIPYNISVIQISHILSSPTAEAPSPAPEATNITGIMSAHGCKEFADTLTSFPDALEVFTTNTEGGLTVFCPSDDAFKGFLPNFKNLTKEEKNSLLLFHGIPVYNSMALLKTSNGVMNTLATDGKNKFDFTVQNAGQKVTLKTKAVTATITATLLDEDPVAIYTIDKVLKPSEIFKKPEISPAPAPAPEAEAPSKGKRHHKSPPAPPSEDDSADSPADSPADGPNADDSTADDSSDGGERVKKGFWMVGVVSVVGVWSMWI